MERKDKLNQRDFKRRTAGAAESLSPADIRAISADFAALRAKLRPPGPMPAMTAAQYGARKAELKRQAAQILERERKTA